ncbi:MAG: hypothetical protein WCF79_18715, partial [Rhodomicrobium sp.]
SRHANGSPLPSSWKGEALSGIVTPWSACLYAVPARAALGRDDDCEASSARSPVGRIGGVCLGDRRRLEHGSKFHSDFVSPSPDYRLDSDHEAVKNRTRPPALSGPGEG